MAAPQSRGRGVCRSRMPCGSFEWSPLRDHRTTDLLKGGRYTAALHMKLQQLRYLAAVVQSDLNITAAAAKLHATQSAISKQLKLLEEELGFDVFARSGRTLTRVTLPGERVIRHALKMLREAEN